MNSRQKKLKNNKKLRVFLLFLALSLLFWMLIKLSREYVGQTTVNLNYTNIPDDKLFQAAPLNKVSVTLKSIGFNLLKQKIGGSNLEVDLADVKRKNGAVYYYETNQLLPNLTSKFSKSEVITIKPDTLFFELGKSISKKLKVWPKVSIEFESGYNFSGELKVEPAEISISGPEAQVDSILEIHTKPYEFKGVNSAIVKELPIEIHKKFPKVTYSARSVTLSGEVEKYTERSIKTSFEIINAPAEYKIVSFPKEVELIFQVGLSDFNTIDASDFKVVCNYKDSELNQIDYLIPNLAKKPTIVKDVKILPSKIQFLLEK